MKSLALVAVLALTATMAPGAADASGPPLPATWVRVPGPFDLPPDYLGAYSRAEDVNDLGVVVGTTIPRDEGSRHAFSWDTSTGTIRGLERLGGNEADPAAINDAGVIVGSSASDPTGEKHAVVWAPPTYAVEDLGTLGGPFSYASDINSAGLIVGSSAAGPTGPVLGFVYDPATDEMTALPSLGGEVTWANGINDLGQVVGESETPAGESHAFVYDPATDEMTDLGTLGGKDSVAFELNDAGIVVGQSETASSTGLEVTAFVFDLDADQMVDLGTFGGGFSTASDVNESGMVVGAAALPSELDVHAFFYDTASAAPSLVDAGTFPGARASGPEAINDTGFVVGRSLSETRTFAWLLAPWQFTDVPPWHTFFDDIEWSAGEDIAGGYPDDTYRPAVDVTRQAMSAFLYRLAGSPPFTPPGVPTFTDVPPSHPFYAEIEWMASVGITTGWPDDTYRPAADVTRQAMSAYLHRLAGSPPFTPPATATFTDVPLTHPFHAEIEWMAAEGVSTGWPDGTYRPATDVTRQAMASFLHRFADGPGVGV